MKTQLQIKIITIMKTYFILIMSFCYLISYGQDQTIIEKNSTNADVHLKLIENDDSDYARIELYTTPPGGILPLNSHGKFQIAGKSYGLDTDPGKALNFWYALNSSNVGRDLLSLQANGVIQLGNVPGNDDFSVLRSSSVDTDAGIFLESIGSVFVDLDTDDQNGLLAIPTFTVRNSNKDLAMSVFENGDVTINGTLTQGSDRNRKENIKSISQAEILSKVADLDIAQWNYIDDDATHIGPMAQDFYSAFGLGDTDKGIASIDSDGIALVAIQALLKRIEALESKLKKSK